MDPLCLDGTVAAAAAGGVILHAFVHVERQIKSPQST